MNTKDYHKRIIGKSARALEELNNQVVYVGGAVVSLYADDPAAPDVRPTDDVDITLKITSRAELEELREKLLSKGFEHSSEEDVICRFYYEDIKVDVMATRDVGWAPANPWFEPGFKDLRNVNIGEISIQILSPAYFLASKLSAFRSRSSDPRTSHDLEDVTYVLDNRTNIVEEIKNAPSDVTEYLIRQFEQILQDSTIKEAIRANMEYSIQAERFSMLEDKLQTIIDSH